MAPDVTWQDKIGFDERMAPVWRPASGPAGGEVCTGHDSLCTELHRLVPHRFEIFA